MYKSKGIERLDVWRKGVDTIRFHPSFKSWSMRKKLSNNNPLDPLIVYIGRMGEEKRLRLIAKILEKIPKARMAFVGDGPDRENLQTHFSKFKGRVIFTGSMVGDELSKAFASADVFVIPSDTETLGFVVLESMASGVPVVGVNAGGIPDLIEDGKTGYLCPPNDASAFAKRISLLLEDKNLRDRMSQSGVKEARRHSWEAATSHLRNVLYKRAQINFKYRAFNGLGLPRTRTKWRFILIQIRNVMKTVQSWASKAWPKFEEMMIDKYGDEVFRTGIA